MRRWWVSLALLLSLGVNLGLLGAIAAGRWAARDEAMPDDPSPLALPGGGRELPEGMAVEIPEPPGSAAGDEGGEATTGEPPAPEPIVVEPSVSVDPAGEPPAAAPADPEATFETPGDRRPRRPRFGRRLHELHGDHRPGELPLDLLADHLGLEGERRERFLDLQRRFLAAHLESRRERARLGAELRAELLAAEPDRQRVEELFAGLADAHAAGERATVEVILASRQLLEPDEQRRYMRFLEYLRDRPEALRHPHRPGR